jgi:hypothetical protein
MNCQIPNSFLHFPLYLAIDPRKTKHVPFQRKTKTAEVICGIGIHGFAERRMKAMEVRMIGVK